VGCRVRVHNYDYTEDSESVLVAVSEDNTLTVSPPFDFVPTSDHVFEFALYSTSTDEQVDAMAKVIHVFVDRTAPVVSGSSQTVFTVGAGDAAFFVPTFPIEVRKADWSVISDETPIESQVGTTITMEDPLGFTPNNTYVCELLAWYDGRGPYRLV
jgi:hypothetical protein